MCCRVVLWFVIEQHNKQELAKRTERTSSARQMMLVLTCSLFDEVKHISADGLDLLSCHVTLIYVVVLASKQCCNMGFLLSSITNIATRTSAIPWAAFRQNMPLSRFRTKIADDPFPYNNCPDCVGLDHMFVFQLAKQKENQVSK